MKPDTSDKINIAGQEQKSLIIVPTCFVSEHLETLVDMDIDYREMASKYKLQYIRVPTLMTNQIFIETISTIICANVQSSGRQFNMICRSYFSNYLSK